MKSGMADYIWRKKGSHRRLRNEMKMLDKEEH